MFNKLKDVASSLGNKKQRAAMAEETEVEEDMNIKLIKLELVEDRIVHMYIKNITDDDEFPTYQMRQALRMNKKMDDEGRKARIEFLEEKKIKTIYPKEGDKKIFPEDFKPRFEKIEEEEKENNDERVP